MPALAQYMADAPIKLLLVGDPGSGKTGALASLAAEGYNLRIIDADKGSEILGNLLMDPQGPYFKQNPKAHEGVFLQPCTDEFRVSAGGKLLPKAPKAWRRISELLDHWRTPELDAEGKALKDRYLEDLGPVSSWGLRDVLVIDSLTTVANAAMNYQLSLVGRLGSKPEQSDWGNAQSALEYMLQALYSDEIKCNVVMICHIVYIDTEAGPSKGYPASLGKALSPKIGRYFNTVLMAQSSGVGANAKQEIHTKSRGIIELKNVNPLRVKASYPLGTGLADYFRDARQKPEGGAKP